MTKKLAEASAAAKELQLHLNNAFNVKTGLILFCGFILLLILALIVDGIKMIQSKINKKHPKPYNLDKGEYAFLSYVDSRCFKESGEQPRSTYRSIGKCTKDSIYVKDGKYFYDWCGKFLPIEESPYFGDDTIGEWGKYKYRYKVVYENTKYCPQGWCYFYFNFPIKND